MNIDISFEERNQLLNMDLDTGDSSMDNGFGEAMLLAGPPGMSAYEVALSNGFAGTEEEWLASLHGERGKAGPAGPAGERGPQGEQGDPGIQGPAGAAGRDGADGKDGKDGIDGRDGVSATHSWNGTVLTITSASGTSSADLEGTRGAAGKDGYTPVRGTDYWTEADKREIVEEVATEIPAPVVSWNDLEDKPFSKEVDSTVYPIAVHELSSYTLDGMEKYTYRASVCYLPYIPGGVVACCPDYGNYTVTVPMIQQNEYEALGMFSIGSTSFAIRCAYAGSGFSIESWATSSGVYGMAIEYRDFAKVNHLPIDYLDFVGLKKNLNLPVTWANLPDKPFNVVEQPVDYPIEGIHDNTQHEMGTYPYISNVFARLDVLPTTVTINAFGTQECVLRKHPARGWMSDNISAGPLSYAVWVYSENDQYLVCLLLTSQWNGTVGSMVGFTSANLIDVRVLPMDEITSSVIAALPRYNGEVADV